MDQIRLCQCYTFERYYFVQSLLFFTGESVSKYMENVKERIAYFTDCKEYFGRNEIIYNNIHTNISLWKEDLESVI